MQYSKLLAALLCLWPSLAWAQLPLTGAGGSGVAANYYTDATSGGSDSNDCLTTSTACLTLAHLNTLNLPAHAVVHCLGSFGSGDALAFTTSNSAGYVTVTDYGAGCTINSGNSTAGITATNLPDVHIIKATALNIVGGGNTTNTTAGISIVNSQAGNTKLAGPSISGVTVSGYGKNCIEIVGSNGSSGFNSWSIGGGTIAHDCTGNYVTSGIQSGSSCINVFSGTDYGSGFVTPAHTNFTITATAYNCTGTSGSTQWSGSAITVFQSSNYTISNSVAHDYGINSVSPGGIWTADGGNCFILDSEVYNGNGATQNSYDFDGGTVNCIGRNLKAHNNAGSDFAMENYNDGTCCALWGSNTFEFVEGQNAAVSELIFFFSAAATGPANVIRSTLINSNPGANLVTQGSSSAISGTVANNILVETGGGNLLSLAHPSSLNFYGNDYYTYGQAVKFAWNGSNYTSFAAWQAATGQEKIGGSNVGLTSNPQIYVPGGLFTSGGYVPADDMADNLQSGSPMIGGGITPAQGGFTLPTSDYYGAAVAANSQTIGAAEGDFGAFSTSCSQASTYLASVSSFSKLDNVNYNSLACGLNSDGIWSHLDFLHVLAAPNSSAALLNLISTSYSLTSHGTNTFTARTGYASNGTTGYLDTGYTPSTAGGNMTLASGSLGVYDLTGGVDSKCPIGATNNTTTEISIFLYTTTAPHPGGFTDINDFTGITSGNSFPSNSTKGLTAGQRSAGDLSIFNDGVTNFPPFGLATIALVPDSIFILAENVAGTAATITTDQIALDFVGDGSFSQPAMSLRANSFMQAYGINVY